MVAGFWNVDIYQRERERVSKAASKPKRQRPGQVPDRSGILTEQRNPRTLGLHTCSVAECVRIIQREDQAVLRAVRGAAGQMTAFIEAAARRFDDSDTPGGGRLIYVGTGTSGRLGVLDASEAPPTFCVAPGRIIGIIAGGDSALRKSSEGMEDDPAGAAAELRALKLTSRDTVLAIAAGGTTPYAVGALAIARKLTRGRCLTALLTCSPVKKPAAADHLIVLKTGPEVLTGSTRMKAGTATKLVLNTISTTLMVQRGRVYQNLMVDVRASNAKLRDRAARIVSTLAGCSRDDAFALVDRAGGSVKVAGVMGVTGLDQEAAERALAKAKGRLDRVKGFKGGFTAPR